MARIAALDFSITANVPKSRRKRTQRTWGPISSHQRLIEPEGGLFEVGRTRFYIVQDLGIGLQSIREHIAQDQQNDSASCSRGSCDAFAILTQTMIVLLQRKSKNELWSTQPQALLDKDLKLRNPALDLLLWATEPVSQTPSLTKLHKLPLEVQDMIVRESSLSLLAAAHISCTMGLGLIGPNFTKADCGYETVNRKHAGRTAGLVVVSKVLLGSDDNVLYYSTEGRFTK